MAGRAAKARGPRPPRADSAGGAEVFSPDSKIAVVGAGSWGTAFASALSHKGLRVVVWARRPELAQYIQQQHENPDYLQGIFLSPKLRASGNLERVVEGAAVIVMAVPAKGFRDVITSVAKFTGPDTPIVSLTKGLETGTLMRMSEVIGDEIPAASPGRVAALSGPNLSHEIARGYPAATVVASANSELADRLQELFMTPIFRTYANPDLIGVELGGVLKNVVAIAVGLAEGLGFQINSRAALMTRGLTEMIRMGTALEARASTFSGLSGIGDLICTCMSPLSRNHRVGVELGKGREIADILGGTREVAEGVESSRAVWALAERHDIYMPICRGVYRVIHEGQDANEMAADLLRLVRQRELD